MDVKLFDVDVNDAAVASSLVNVTSVPTLILIPPVPPHAATSHGHSTVCAAIIARHTRPCLHSPVDAVIPGHSLCTTAWSLLEKRLRSCLISVHNKKLHL